MEIELTAIARHGSEPIAKDLGSLLIDLKQWTPAQQQYEAIYRLVSRGYAAYNAALCEENKQRKDAAAS